MTWSATHREAMFAAAQLHDDLGIDCMRRVDAFGAIRKLDIQVMFRPLRGCAGVYFPPLSGVAGILIHSGHPTRLQRYTAAHELGHHVFGHGHALDATDVLLRSDDHCHDPRESLVEAFAAWFLMPPELVDSLLTLLNLKNPLRARDVYGLSLRLGTSYRATCVHLRTLGLLSSTQAVQLLSIPPRAIKEQIAPAAKARSWHRDIWLVSLDVPRELLVVSSGDQIVLQDSVVEGEPELRLWQQAGAEDESSEVYRARDLAVFEVPESTCGSRWDVDFVDDVSGVVKATVRLAVETSRIGLLVQSDSSLTSKQHLQIKIQG